MIGKMIIKDMEKNKTEYWNGGYWLFFMGWFSLQVGGGQVHGLGQGVLWPERSEQR